jgi:allantoinase
MPHELVIRAATLVRETVERGDIGISGGKIAEISPEIRGGTEEINAAGLHVFPGVLDPHVHFNEPGRTDWEGFSTGSSAFAAGGGTCFFDMPLNSSPPTLDAPSFDLKRAAAEKNSLTDFGLWGGLVPANVDSLDGLHERGVVGLKAFMCNSGIDDFPRADDDTLYNGMRWAAAHDTLVAVHAENEEITAGEAKRAIARGARSVRDYLNSRPIVAELDAINRAILIAKETACRLHIVHVSCGRGVALVAEARQRGVKVTCETCPHYVVLSDEDVERLGAIAKCAPPIRDAASSRELWGHLITGHVDFVASDHSPSPPEMKQSKNFFEVWGGISGVQSLFPLMLARFEGARELLPLLWRITSGNAAKLFRIAGKGAIEVGNDADFLFVDLRDKFMIRADDLLYRHKVSPFVRRPARGVIRRTMLRGNTIYLNGKVVSSPIGKLVRPTREVSR